MCVNHALMSWKRATMTNKVFDYVNSVTQNKKNLMRGSENDELSEKGYDAYLTNKALSYHEDTVFHANIMNINHHLDKRPQYEFLINSIRPRKRFAKWVKGVSNEDLDFVCSYYECSKTKGQEYLSLLSLDQLKIMKKEKEKGGNKT